MGWPEDEVPRLSHPHPPPGHPPLAGATGQSGGLSAEQLQWMLANPAQAHRLLDWADAEDSLLSFIEMGWEALEPGRTFVKGWAVEAICEHLEAVTKGHIRRLLINVPPGCMKSLTTNVFWPAWEWGPRNMPWLRYVAASYSQSLTVRDNRRARQLMAAPFYQEAWGDRFEVSQDEANKVKFSNNRTGFKLATSVGGYVMGERGDRVIVDDPNNTKEVESATALDNALQWVTEVLPTRINDPEKSAIVVIMQRTHERDVSGHILDNVPGYEHLMLPMEFEEERRCHTCIGFQDPRTREGELLWPERFSEHYLETDLKPTLRSWGGTFAEAGQLQQRPAPRGGGMFQEADFQYLDSPPECLARVRAWDLASSKDGHAAHTVGLLMGMDQDRRVVIMDVRRGQWSPGEVNREVRRAAEDDGPSVSIDLPKDPGQAGSHQINSFARMLHGYNMRSTAESGSKEDRARPLAAQAEARNVYLVRGRWNSEFLREACVFPAGKFKDQVDAASRAYAALIRRRPRLPGGGLRVIN